jgi:hypothetical protein
MGFSAFFWQKLADLLQVVVELHQVGCELA